jgi:hypothetical protein
MASVSPACSSSESASASSACESSPPESSSPLSSSDFFALWFVFVLLILILFLVVVGWHRSSAISERHQHPRKAGEGILIVQPFSQVIQAGAASSSIHCRQRLTIVSRSSAPAGRSAFRARSWRPLSSGASERSVASVKFARAYLSSSIEPILSATPDMRSEPIASQRACSTAS